ncbi:MAG: DUF1292 domain-containing protein [Oscillospiraceae bacterium]|nr:DUF1292 domain-containing protein [Oscillospiraceae bacterium]
MDGEKEYIVFNVTTKSGRELEMAVLDEFDFEHKDYVAAGQIVDDTVDDNNIFIYRVKTTEDDFVVSEIDDPEEYEKVGQAYLDLIEE